MGFLCKLRTPSLGSCFKISKISGSDIKLFSRSKILELFSKTKSTTWSYSILGQSSRPRRSSNPIILFEERYSDLRFTKPFKFSTLFKRFSDKFRASKWDRWSKFSIFSMAFCCKYLENEKNNRTNSTYKHRNSVWFDKFSILVMEFPSIHKTRSPVNSSKFSIFENPLKWRYNFSFSSGVKNSFFSLHIVRSSFLVILAPSSNSISMFYK